MRSLFEVGFGKLLRKKNPHAALHFLHMGLLPLSHAFRLCVSLRNFLYDRGIWSQKKCSVPVVSIGNVVAGGTGKTPLTLHLAKSLSNFCKVAILSRGYRSKAEKGHVPLLLCKGNGPLLKVEECGDEAFLLASRVPNAIVIVGKNRFLSAERAIKEGAELILLDDGMQHRKIFRDIEVSVVNGNNPLGGGYFLPRGFLRDEPRRLLLSDLIVVNGKKENNFPIKEMQTVEVYNKPVAIVDVFDKEIVSLSGVPVGVFCGIAEPSRFSETLKNLGAHIVMEHFLADHIGISLKQLFFIAEKAKKKGAQWLLCTEKDKVKLFLDEETKKKLPLPLAWVKSELFIQSNQLAWDGLIEKIKHLVRR